MSAENQRVPRKRKRKVAVAGTHRKLGVDEKVEVRSKEDGILGSWHLATVIGSDDLTRRVRYDHLLSEEGSYLAELVSVSPMLDGVVLADDQMPVHRRGAFRPLPPPCSFSKLPLPYGHCVDYFHQDAWWEGVIFDREENAEERRIFFPDMGDEMKAHFDKLRATQDWDETTEEWVPRSSWIFLEVVEEIEKDYPLLISVKQIWYEVQLKKDYIENLKDWTCSSSRDIWRSLVIEVVHDNTKLTIKHFLSQLNSSPEFSELAPDAKLNIKTYFDQSVEKQFDSDGIPPHQKEEKPDIPGCDFSVVPACTKDISGILSSSKSESVALTSIKRRRGRPPKKEKRLKLENPVNKPDICPDTIAKYDPSISSVKKFKKHLLHLGWKFELVMDCNVIRKRYIAPNGAVCLSLSQACKMLEKSKGSEPVPPSVDIKTCLNGPPAKPSAQQTCREEMSELSSETVIIDPEICPNAVINYNRMSQENRKSKLGVKVSEISEKAKKHLAATGWTFYYIGKKDRKLRYVSPEGKGFNSLRKICKWLVHKWEAEKRYLPEQESENNSSEKLTEPLQHGKVKISCRTRPRKKRRHGDENDINKSQHSLKKGDGIGPKLPTKRARKAAALSCSFQNTPRTVLSWLIDNNMILLHAKVFYCGKKYGKSMAEGRITREGIKCNCCQKIYGVCTFEAHAGAGSSSPNALPSANIFLEDGRSLLECQMQMKRKQFVKKARKESRAVKKKGVRFNTNDSVCSVCHYGGKLLMCDNCPSSFHPDCLGMKEVPNGDWFCPSCCCKACGESGFDTNRNQFTDNSALICCQCEHKYHARCMRNEGPGKLDNYPEGNWFCNKRCELIFTGMHDLLGKPVIVGTNNLTWTLLKYIEPDDSGSTITDYESSVENYSRLNVALDVIHECFEPVKEHDTSSDIVEDVIFSRWSELKRLNFQGFYTVLLERNDELIAVATVRVYGEEVAEIPLVATLFQHRRLGMCRILMNELEKKLIELRVQRLVLPAVPSVLDTWTNSFGFSVVKEAEKINFLDYTLLGFQGTIMCQKILQKSIPSAVSSVSTESQQILLDNTNSKDGVALEVEDRATVEQDQGSANEGK